jgi:6-phospho-3-hexuloisomerase
MEFKQLQSKLINEAAVALGTINETDVDVFIKEILGARKIFIYGLGRERLMLQAFAMRLVHLGFDVHVVGDVTSPRIEEKDLFITSSGTGYLATVEALLKIVKKAGARVVYITANTESELSHYADLTIHIKAQTMKEDIEERTSLQPLGAVFEQAQLFLFELIIVRLKQQIKISEKEMEKFHTNLE